MTSYVKIGVKYGKNFFSTLSTLTTESSHIYFVWAKTKLTGSKGHISVRIDQNWPIWRHFGHKMTSYVEIGVRYDKNFFFNIIDFHYWVISYILFGGKSGVKRVKKLKISKKNVFSLYFLYKMPIKCLFYKNIVHYPCSTTFQR